MIFMLLPHAMDFPRMEGMSYIDVLFRQMLREGLCKWIAWIFTSPDANVLKNLLSTLSMA